MNAQDRYNSERYPDMTCFLALRNIERNERKERKKGTEKPHEGKLDLPQRRRVSC